jgi:hypothetical protein
MEQPVPDQNQPGRQRPLVLGLEINRPAPLEGQVRSRDGLCRPFAGWAGLAATLAAFLDDWDPEHATEA